mgnify:CR=1 FL=1
MHLQLEQNETFQRHCLRTISLTAFIVLSGFAANAQSNKASDKDALILELQQRLSAQEERLARLEALLESSSLPGEPASMREETQRLAVSQPAAPMPATTSPALAGLSVSGDARLRYEYNNASDGQRNDSRGVVRARLAARYQLSPTLEIGARMVTGDPDDPNSADVSLSNFADDLQVSLDQLFARKSLGNLTLTGGKFANPFRRTDLVWDGDVNPQGVAAQYEAYESASTRLAGSVLYFPIERSVAGADSTAQGGQITLDTQASKNWAFGLAAGYYDYDIEAVATANSGDIRTNRLGIGSGYMSDFDLVDIIASVNFAGLGERWPVSVQAEYVENLGADDYDTGYMLSASAGQTSTVGGLSIGYAYHVAEADAVFAAFAQDNIPLGSNYLQHAIGLTYALSDHVDLGTNIYAYRLKDIELGGLPNDDWQQRIRVNLVAKF